MLWNSDILTVHDSLIGRFSLTILVSLVGFDKKKWVCTWVYGPCDLRYKQAFWNELGNIRLAWGLPWLLVGYFNATRQASERTSGYFVRRVAQGFNSLVENFGLCEFGHAGPSFTYSNKGSPPVLSRLDR